MAYTHYFTRMESFLADVKDVLMEAVPVITYDQYTSLYTCIYNATLAEKEYPRRRILTQVEAFLAENLPGWTVEQRSVAKALFRYLRPEKQGYDVDQFPNLAQLFASSS